MLGRLRNLFAINAMGNWAFLHPGSTFLRVPARIVIIMARTFAAICILICKIFRTRRIYNYFFLFPPGDFHVHILLVRDLISDFCSFLIAKLNACFPVQDRLIAAHEMEPLFFASLEWMAISAIRDTGGAVLEKGFERKIKTPNQDCAFDEKKMSTNRH